jgi:hemolysin activation/secretion protein
MNAARKKRVWLPRAVAPWLHAAASGCMLLACSPVPAQDRYQAAPVAPPPAAEDNARFDVLEYVIEGNTVLPVATIESTVTPFLGPNRPMADVEAARAALEKAYQGAGFLSVFVDIPEQRVEDGVITLKVIEGRVARLSVTGSRYFSQGYIRDKVGEFGEGQVPNFNEAQRQLALVNRSEERRVQPVLRPGRLPGTVEVELKVSDALPLSGTVELNNQHAADTVPWRVSGSLRYDNLFQRDHSLSMTAITAPQQPSQSQVLVTNYSIPLDSGNSFTGYAVLSDSSVETLGGVTALGKGTTLGLRYSVPFYSTTGTHSLSFGADYKDLEQRIVTAGASGSSGTVFTPLRYLPFQLAYSGSWSDAGAQTQLNLTFIAALKRVLQRTLPDCPRPDGSVGAEDQFACSRKGADGGFSLLRADLRHSEPLPGGSLLSLRLAGQLAPNPLVSGEQFSIGGAETVRGYLESAASGDNAVLGSLQWRSPLAGSLFADTPADGIRAPKAAAAAAAWWASFAAVAFVDVGRVSLIDPAVGQAARVPLLGSGFGLRLDTPGGVSAALDLAWPLKATATQPSGSARVHARVAMRF